MTYQDDLDAKAAAVLEQMKAERSGSLLRWFAGLGVSVVVYVVVLLAFGLFAAYVLSPASVALDARPWFQQKVVLVGGVAALAAILWLFLRRRV